MTVAPTGEPRQRSQPGPWLVVGAGLVWTAFHLWTLVRYPAVTCDEAFYGRGALAYIAGLGSSSDWPQVGLNFYLPYGRFYWLMLGGALNLLGTSIFAARLTSLIGWGALIAATYWLGVRYSTRRAAWWSAALIAAAWIPLLAGHRARPDIWAAAAGTACLAFAHYVEERGSSRLYLLLGAALGLQLAFHPIVIYLTAGVMLAAAIHAFREKRAIGIVLLLIAYGLTTGLIVWWRLGSAMPVLIGQFASDPWGALRSYNLAGAGGSGDVLAGLAGAGVWLAEFWWRSYAWLAPAVSLPQGALFVMGQGYGLFGSAHRLRSLGVIALVSLLLFGLINAGYTAPPGYALQWMPAYFVLGTAALHDLGRRVPALSDKVEWATLAAGGLAVLYTVGTLWLVFRQPSGEYQRVASAIRSQLVPGDRVLASPIWWYALDGDASFVDEALLAPEHSILWWNSIPEDSARPGTQPLEPLVPLSEDEARLAEQMGSRFLAIGQPSIVTIGDGSFACLDEDAYPSRVLTGLLGTYCTPRAEIDSVSYGTQTIYQCTGQMESE